MQTVAIPARYSVGTEIQKSPDVIEGSFLPDLQDNDLPLILGQGFQTTHRGTLSWRFLAARIEPPMKLKFARQPTPESSMMVHRPIPKRTNTVVRRILWGFLELHERHEGFLEDVFGLSVAESERPAVKYEPGGPLLIQSFAPTRIS